MDLIATADELQFIVKLIFDHMHVRALVYYAVSTLVNVLIRGMCEHIPEHCLTSEVCKW